MCGEENKRRDSIEKILNTEASAIKGTHRYLDIGLHSSFMEKILPGTKRPRCTSIFHSAINPTSRSNKLNGQINREQNFPPNKPLPRLKITHRRMKLDGKGGGGNLRGIPSFPIKSRPGEDKFLLVSKFENFPPLNVP